MLLSGDLCCKVKSFARFGFNLLACGVSSTNFEFS